MLKKRKKKEKKWRLVDWLFFLVSHLSELEMRSFLGELSLDYGSDEYKPE